MASPILGPNSIDLFFKKRSCLLFHLALIYVRLSVVTDGFAEAVDVTYTIQSFRRQYDN